MSFELVMPRAGLTMVEGTISAWTVPEGAGVKKGDTIMEFENEKNTIEFASTHDGILHIIAQEGDVVAVGAPIGCVAESQEEYAALCGGQSAPASAPEPVAAAPAAAAPAAAETAPERGGKRVRITGLARKMARQHEIPLTELKGTGPNGRIIAQDVKDYLEAKTAAPIAAPVQQPVKSDLPALLRQNIRTQLSMLDQKQSCAVQTAAVNDGVPLHDLFPCPARQTLLLPGSQFVPAREKVFHFHGDPRLSCTYYTGVYSICQLYSYCQVRSKKVTRVPNSLLTRCQAEGKKMQRRSCGRLVVGTKAPETCPVCNHPQSCFEVRKDNY